MVKRLRCERLSSVRNIMEKVGRKIPINCIDNLSQNNDASVQKTDKITRKFSSTDDAVTDGKFFLTLLFLGKQRDSTELFKYFGSENLKLALNHPHDSSKPVHRHQQEEDTSPVDNL